MQSKRLPLPEQRGYDMAYELAYKLAREQFVQVADIEALCARSGTRLQPVGSKKVIIVEHLNQTYQVTFPDIEVSLVGSQEAMPLRQKILILHYLNLAKGTPLTNKLITYKELPTAIYFPTFFKRAIKPLVDNFGQEPQQLIEVAARLGGQKANYGDVAVTIKAFSRGEIRITPAKWKKNCSLAEIKSSLKTAK